MNTDTASKFLEQLHRNHLDQPTSVSGAAESYRLVFNRGGRARNVELSSKSHPERLQRACTALSLIRADEVVLQMDMLCCKNLFFRADILLVSASAICPDIRYKLFIAGRDSDLPIELPTEVIDVIADYLELRNTDPLVECGVDLDLIAIAATNAPVKPGR